MRYLWRFVTAAFLALALTVSATGCAWLANLDTQMVVTQDALSESTEAMQLLDMAAVAYLDSLIEPTNEEIRAAEDGVRSLKFAHTHLIEARQLVVDGRASEAAAFISFGLDELRRTSDWLGKAGWHTANTDQARLLLELAQRHIDQMGP
jgi:hypothetical protein